MAATRHPTESFFQQQQQQKQVAADDHVVIGCLPALTDENLIQLARLELNEHADTRHKYIEELRQLVVNDAQLHCRTDDVFLIQFLRHRKFDVVEAHQRIRKYLLTRGSHRDVFSNYSAASLHDVFLSGVVSVLPHEDRHGRRVLLYRPGLWNYRTTSREQLLKASALILDRLLMEDSVQICGVTTIIDLSHLSIKRVLKLGSNFASKFNAVISKAVPLRVKKIFIVNGGHVFNVLHRMTAMFFSDKMKVRVQNCGSNIDNLVKNLCGNDPLVLEVASKMLPCGEEFGNIGRVSVSNNCSLILDDLLRFDEIFLSHSQKYFIDVAK